MFKRTDPGRGAGAGVGACRKRCRCRYRCMQEKVQVQVKCLCRWRSFVKETKSVKLVFLISFPLADEEEVVLCIFILFLLLFLDLSFLLGDGGPEGGAGGAG